MKHLLVFIFGLFFLSAYSQNGSIIIRGGGGGVSLDSNNFWKIHGNSSTNPSTNFLGTTDAQDLVIKTNNTEAMRIDTNGNVGIGTAVPAMKLGINGSFGVLDSIYTDYFLLVRPSIGEIVIGDGAASVNGTQIRLNDNTRNIQVSNCTLLQIASDTVSISGNVGIGPGIGAPTSTLHVNGTTRLEGTPQSTTSDSLLTIDDAGNVAWRTPYYYGTDTLTNGVDTVWTSDITSNSMIQLTSNGLNGSIQAGILDVTEISDGNYFIVNSLKTNTNIEADDQRKYYWFFIRKP